MSFARPRSSGLSLLCLGLLAASAHAASITFVGIESGKTVENWSNPNPLIDEMLGDLNDKTWDLNGDNRFGGAGYYQITPDADTESWVIDVLPDNDLGVSEEFPTLALTPSFLAGIPVGVAGRFINTDLFPSFMDPAGESLIRQGSLWIAQPENPDDLEYGTAPGDIEGIRYTAFSFTLKDTAAFRMGVAVDGLADGDFSVDFVSITHVGTGEEFSTPLTRDGLPDMVFFDIQGDPDDEFVVSLWEANESLTGARVASFSLITFDQEPVPNLSHVLDGSNLTLSWEPEIPGWTLESSTNLGISDWTAVTEPPVVNNSVTLDISDVPKNFFRLRKDP